MPYETKLTREKRSWITLAQAVEYVASAEGARDDGLPKSFDTRVFGYEMPSDNVSPSFREALSQIRLALADGEIPVRWARDSWPTEKTFIPGALFSDDEPPSGEFWKIAAINSSKNYAVLDPPVVKSMDVEGVEYIDLVRPSLQTKKGRYRQLLLFRSRIYELWPQDKTSAKVKAGSYKNRQSPPTDEEILKVVRELYEVTDPPPNIVKAEQLVRAKLPTAKREQIKATLKTPEFSQKRRPPGNQKKAR